MAKHKKTRKQKQTADVRRHNASPGAPVFVPKEQQKVQYETQPSQPIQFSLSQLKPTATPTIPNSLLHPAYVAGDLTHTAIITFGILAAEIILFIFLHNHVLAMPGG